jgi:sec-independent protein translocase protein TatC
VKYQYSDDLFADTRMSFGEHIEDLRTHLLRALKWFVLALVVSFFVGKYVMHFITRPVEESLQKYYDRRYEKILAQLKDDLKNNPNSKLAEMNKPKPMTVTIPAQSWYDQMKGIDPQLVGTAERPTDSARIEMTMLIQNPFEFMHELKPIQDQIGRRPGLTTLSVQEAFMVYFKISLLTGFVLASPFIFYEMWIFVAAGLYPHEKHWVYAYLPLSIFLFLAGVLATEFLVIPRAIEALLWFNEWLDLEPDFRLNEWLNFAIIVPLIFGLGFQLPIVMLFLQKIGVFTPEDFAAKRRIAYFVMIILAALGPTVDPFSLLMLWIPLCFLYELGIIMSKYSRSSAQTEDYEVPYTPENGTTTDGQSNREESSSGPPS